MVNNFYNQLTQRNEQKLVEDILIEQIKAKGMNVYYAPKKFVCLDQLTGEDPAKAFDSAYTVEMYFENVDGFTGDKNFINALGLNIDKRATFVCSVSRFSQIIKAGHYNFQPQVITANYVRPEEGDLIYLPLTNDLFEVNFADHESVFYQLGKVYVWKITCSKFDYSDEKFSTGVSEIDCIATQLENENNVDNDPSADNENINTDITGILDTTVKNPFKG